MNRRSKGKWVAMIAAACFAASTAQAAAVIVKDTSNINTIPGLTGFQTLGSMMSGLKVTASFSNSTSSSLFWATTGAQSGGVTGAGWGLSLDGDTFSALWNFTIDGNAGLGQLVSLVLDGTDAFTVFDTSDPSPGTDGSANGQDFVFQDAGLNATATYSSVVAVSPDGPVGDLFQKLTVSFGGDGPRTGFTFQQDTDNDARFGKVPEPGTVALLGLALAGLGASLRRRGRA